MCGAAAPPIPAQRDDAARSTPPRCELPDGAERRSRGRLQHGRGQPLPRRRCRGAAQRHRRRPVAAVRRARPASSPAGSPSTFAIGDGRALDVRATRASTPSCSTRRCATCRSASGRWPRRTACCGRAGGSRCSTATTRRRRSRATRADPLQSCAEAGARDARARPVADAAARAAAPQAGLRGRRSVRGHAYAAVGRAPTTSTRRWTAARTRSPPRGTVAPGARRGAQGRGAARGWAGAFFGHIALRDAQARPTRARLTPRPPPADRRSS